MMKYATVNLMKNYLKRILIEFRGLVARFIYTGLLYASVQANTFFIKCPAFSVFLSRIKLTKFREMQGIWLTPEEWHYSSLSKVKVKKITLGPRGPGYP